MIYPWPLNVDAELNEALEIAMHYLEVTGQADAFFQTQAIAASAILNARRAGARHKIRLAIPPLSLSKTTSSRLRVNRDRNPSILASASPGS